ncbi:MAG TPA: flagellar hook capping FlgD N-terminal domain-containing protein [Tepidisphaeraceae bacterium]|nr:flagellar hook capping FlgD N-terminal domain-containing protein [Tepidisphaeraceae bacterium]
MTTSPVSSTTTSNTTQSKKKELTADDFIKIMITQLQNQDPTEPMKNEELLSQMSQISQLQSNTSLQKTLSGLAAQNQIGSAGQLIGKMVGGIDENDEKVTGLVNSVRVEDGKIYLELDNGKTLPVDNVTDIAPGPGGTTGSSGGTTHRPPA